MPEARKGLAVIGGVLGFVFLLSQFIFWGGTSTGIVREHCLDVPASESANSVVVDSHWTLIVFPPLVFSGVDPNGRCVRNTPLREGLNAAGIWKLDSPAEQVRTHALAQYEQAQEASE